MEERNYSLVLYTVKEAAEIMHTNPTYVYNLIKSGALPVLKLGSFKIRAEALGDFLKANEGNDLSDPYNIIPLNAG